MNDAIYTNNARSLLRSHRRCDERRRATLS
jgi:hypothetical protein